MSFLYANKCKMDLNPFLRRLREELYVEPFSLIDFTGHRNTVALSDIKQPQAPILNYLNMGLRMWETYARPQWLHDQANQTVRALVQREDDNTSYNDLAPVNKALQMMVVYFSDGEDAKSLVRHREKLSTYLWQSKDGMTCGGTNGAQVWDTAFTILAVFEAGLAEDPRFKKAMTKALEFLDISQFRDNLIDPYRQRRKGGWPFSTKDNGYIVSDCSAEAMKAIILLQETWYVFINAC